jgi:hypothetical protein
VVRPGVGGRRRSRRIELFEDIHFEHYAEVPGVGAERLEIQFIEETVAARGRRVGTRAVHGLAERHPDRRLLAYREGAEGFWASLGWERFDHPEGRPEFHRALFIQPAG